MRSQTAGSAAFRNKTQRARSWSSLLYSCHLFIVVYVERLGVARVEIVIIIVLLTRFVRDTDKILSILLIILTGKLMMNNKFIPVIIDII